MNIFPHKFKLGVLPLKGILHYVSDYLDLSGALGFFANVADCEALKFSVI